MKKVSTASGNPIVYETRRSSPESYLEDCRSPKSLYALESAL
jgi:hypothetical protein